ncbi:MAG: DoxX family protein [Terracidiphilus sp.]|jgi:putative oxidoreductase
MTRPFAFLSSVYDLYSRALNRLQSPLLLLIRLYWGWQFAQTGWGKLQHLDRVADFFQTLNIPSPHLSALVVALIELVGGIMLALGIGSRIVALVLFVNMSVAFVAGDRDALAQILSNPGKFYGADPYTFWFAALLILIFGPGWIAVDTLLSRLKSDPTIIEKQDLLAQSRMEVGSKAR